MDPQGNQFSFELIDQLYQLAHDGATILLREKPEIRDPENATPGTHYRLMELWGAEAIAPIGRGRVLRGPWTASTLQEIGLAPAIEYRDAGGHPVQDVAWCQRSASTGTVFFLSNQSGQALHLTASFNVRGLVPELWDPLTGEAGRIPQWTVRDGRIEAALAFEPDQSCFIVFRKNTEAQSGGAPAPAISRVMEIPGPWSVAFDPKSGGPAGVLTFDQLTDWTRHVDPLIRHYAGTAAYETTFTLPVGALGSNARFFLDLGSVANLAEVTVNGQACGVAWTDPMRLDVTAALRPGENQLRILVTTTWANRLVGDHALEAGSRQTWTTAPYRL